MPLLSDIRDNYLDGLYASQWLWTYEISVISWTVFSEQPVKILIISDDLFLPQINFKSKKSETYGSIASILQTPGYDLGRIRVSSTRHNQQHMEIVHYSDQNVFYYYDQSLAAFR